MTNATAFFVQQRRVRFAQQARDAAARVRRASTLREVRDWGSEPHDSLISSVVHCLPELRQLRFAREQRAGEIVKVQLKELADSLDKEGLESFRTRVGALRMNHWVFLRGEHAGLLQQIDRELARLEYAARKKVPPSEAPEQA